MESASGGQLLAETDFGGVQDNAHLPKRSRISAAWRVEIYGRNKNIARLVRKESDGITIEWGAAAEVVRLCQRIDISRLPKTPTILLTMRIRTNDAVAFDSAFG